MRASPRRGPCATLLGMITAAIGLGSAGAGALLWKLARGRVRTYWIVLAALVGAMTGLMGARLSALPQTSRSDLIEQIAAAIVALSWWFVVRGAMRDKIKDKQPERHDGGRWYLD